MAGFDQVDSLIDPDLVQMQDAIHKLFDKRVKDDLLLLYFSGHGLKDTNTNHLFLANCQTGKENFRSRAMPARRVQEASQSCMSRRQIIILDCCFSGAFSDGWKAKGAGLDLQQELGAEGRVVLTSSDAYEQSFQQDGDESLSLYTQYLVEGIETGAADKDKDGNIYVQELHAYAKAKVQEVKPEMKPDIINDQEGFNILLSKAPLNDPTLEFRRLVEPHAKKGEISELRREILQTQWGKMGLTDEAANAIINSVLEPFRKRLANVAKFETKLRKEVEKQFPLPAEVEQDLRDVQQQVLGLADDDVSEIWRSVLENKKVVVPPPAPTPVPVPAPAAPSISTFEFQVATLREQTEMQGGIFGVGKKEVITYAIARTQKRAEYFTEKLSNNVFLDMVAIPAGSFQMGSTENSGEKPVHQVTIAPFSLGRYPVTQAQWKVVAALPKVKHDLETDPSNFKGSDRPVEKIYWREAVEFCDRLSRKTGRTYRLPTEAEWEYACRAGTTTAYHFGEAITHDLANYSGGAGSTTPVGSFGVANAFGLYDMHGNVLEWCADHWHENYKGAPIDGSAWLTDNKESSRLLRGGSWNDNSGYCRSAYRNHNNPDSGFSSIGFRVVCSSAWTL